MASNLCIQNGTALAKQTVFSALRQDLCRRLLNTSRLEDDEIFVDWTWLRDISRDYLIVDIDSALLNLLCYRA